MRFEKSLDPNLTEVAILRFLTLLQKLCPAMKIASALVDINNTAVADKEIDLDLRWLVDKIGQEIPSEKASDILVKLGFTINKDKTPVWRVTVPSWRATKDISAREDLAEEILRLYGYDNIVSTLPVQILNLPNVNQERVLERKIKNILAGKFSLSEMYNYSFVGEDQLSKLKIDFSNYLRIANPLSDVATMLRQSLAPGLIGNVKSNQFKADDLGFFEIGSTFFRTSGNLSKGLIEGETLPYQEKRLGLVLAGGSDDLLGQTKGIIVNLFQNLFNYQTETEFFVLENIPGWADRNMVAKIFVRGKEIGLVAGLNKEVSANINLKKVGVIAEINFRLLADLVLSQETTRYQETSKYPPVSRDIAFVVDDKIMYNDLRNEIAKFDCLIKSVELFDVYSGDRLASGQKSLAFRLSYQSPDRTLTAVEVDKIQKRLVEHLAKKFAVKLRDF
jgi:phenylalanyl-tRNA synthetase beta chain